MSKEKIKVYLYTRVSTTMQIDGYSLDSQKTKMKAFCDYNEYEIAGGYEDAGKLMICPNDLRRTQRKWSVAEIHRI